MPRIFSITKNPEETIQFLNHIIKCVESIRFLLKSKNINFVRLYFIDMKSTEIITSDALMYLLTIISSTRETKLLPISWKGNLPEKNDVRDYVKKSGYLKYMSTASENIIETDNNVQIKHGVGYTYDENEIDIRQEIIDFTCAKLNKDKRKVNFLMTMLTEMITNISDHAYQKYAYEPKEEDSAFVPLDNIDLSNILCIRDKRTMLSGNVISWKNNYYQILDKDDSVKHIFKGTEVEVYQNVLTKIVKVKYYNNFYETKQIEGHKQDPIKREQLRIDNQKQLEQVLKERDERLKARANKVSS